MNIHGAFGGRFLQENVAVRVLKIGINSNADLFESNLMKA